MVVMLVTVMVVNEGFVVMVSDNSCFDVGNGCDVSGCDSGG